MLKYSGIVESVIFRNEDNGYSVLSVKPDDGRSFTAVGTIPFADQGDRLSLEGEWTEHSAYGSQFKVASFSFCAPEGRDALEKYLASGLIKGIGDKMAHEIVRHFGADTLSVLDTHPERLLEVNGIGKKKASGIIASYTERRDAQNAIMYFLSIGISPGIAGRIYAQYKADAILVAKLDPYRLADEIRGIGFRIADRIALSQGYAMNDERRLSSGVKYVLEEAMNNEGHTCLPESELLIQAGQILEADIEDVLRAVSAMILKNELVCDRLNDDDFIFLKRAYECEADIALRLKYLLINGESSGSESIQVPEALSDGTVLSEAQKDALRVALGHPVSVITGGPGTGKTTLIRGLIDLVPSLFSVALTAPTGRAAKRMSEATGRDALTIHRLLEYGQHGSEGFARNEDKPLKASVVIVDEMSMVDIFLMRALLKALRPGSRLVMVGDSDQLPSVGAGNVLKDMIQSGKVPLVKLSEVFRQSAQSEIVMNAHRINRGEMPVMNGKGSDFFIEKAETASVAAQGAVELVMKRLPAYKGFDALKDIQVMAPMKKGDAGVNALNFLLQRSLNPPGNRPFVKRGETCFYRGDKVMQTRNDYSIGWTRANEEGEGVFNGDIGYVTQIDPQEIRLSVCFEDGRLAVYEKDMLEDLELAYCMSVHKSQGSEFPCVVLPLISGPPLLMTRNLLYTAVTRARRLVVIIGRPGCVKQMVLNDHTQARYSSLCERLKRAL